jgi:hypothetical protein
VAVVVVVVIVVAAAPGWAVVGLTGAGKVGNVRTPVVVAGFVVACVVMELAGAKVVCRAAAVVAGATAGCGGAAWLGDLGALCVSKFFRKNASALSKEAAVCAWVWKAVFAADTGDFSGPVGSQNAAASTAATIPTAAAIFANRFNGITPFHPMKK